MHADTLIAHEAQCDRRTVRKALRGEPVHPAILERIERAVARLSGPGAPSQGVASAPAAPRAVVDSSGQEPRP